MKLLLHTPGEPGGIGIECLLKQAQTPHDYCRVALTDAALLKQQSDSLGLPIKLLEINPLADELPATAAGELYVLPKLALTEFVATRFGQCLSAHARLQLQALDTAVELLAQREGALITGPVQKSALAHERPDFRGHTEYLADRADISRVVMMLACPKLRVALVTTHLPLREVAYALETTDIAQCLQILAQDLRQKFGLPLPRIAVCGLNPHAGEDGLLGSEEQNIIQPAIELARGSGLSITGPWPADTIFTPRRLESVDAVLAMYHDQGLPTLKYAGFGEAVNITLGLPFIRTSVDHGTGLDIAGKGIADPGSLAAAERMACSMLQAQHRQIAHP